MLKQIADLVKQYGQDTVVNNPEIPQEVHKDVLTEATHTITGGMQNMLAGGGLQDILSLFKGGGGQQANKKSGGIGGLFKNPMILMMIGHFIGKLINKFKLKPDQASKVSNNLIPNVVGDIVNRTNDNSPENDSFDLDDLISTFTGGKTSSNGNSSGFNFQGLLDKFKGNGTGDTNGNGFHLKDIIGQITHRAQENQAQGGGLMNLIKSFI